MTPGFRSVPGPHHGNCARFVVAGRLAPASFFYTFYFESVASCGSSGRAGSTLMESMWVWTQPLLTFIGSPSRTSAEHLISSHLISSHLISSHLISSHLMSSHLISLSQYLISSHLISSHLISLSLSSHLISSHLASQTHLISSHLVVSLSLSESSSSCRPGSSPHFLSIFFLPPDARESRDHHRTSSHVVVLALSPSSSHVVVLSLSPSSSCRQMHASHGIITALPLMSSCSLTIITALPLMSSFFLSHQCTGVTGSSPHFLSCRRSFSLTIFLPAARIITACRRSCSLTIFFLPSHGSHGIITALPLMSSFLLSDLVLPQVHGSHGIITALPLMSSFFLSHHLLPAARRMRVTGLSPHFLSCRRSCSLIILFLPPGARESRDHHRTSSHVVVLSLLPSSSSRQMHASHGIITALPLMSSFLLSHHLLPAARCTGVTGSSPHFLSCRRSSLYHYPLPAARRTGVTGSSPHFLSCRRSSSLSSSCRQAHGSHGTMTTPY